VPRSEQYLITRRKSFPLNQPPTVAVYEGVSRSFRTGGKTH